MLLAVGLLTVLAIFAASRSIATSFADLEQRRGQHEGERARRLLGLQLQELLTTTIDYAYWEDAMRFVTGQSDAFLTDNITEENMKYLRLSEVLVLDASLQPKAGAHLAGDGDQEIQLSSSDLAPRLVKLAAPVLADASGFATVSTFLVHQDGLFVVAIAAVRSPSLGSGPPVGALVMARRFDQRELLRLSEVLMLSTGLDLQAASQQRGPVELDLLSDTRSVVRAGIQDAQGETVAVLRIAIDRVLEQEARSLILRAGIQMLLGGLLVGSLLVILMDRWVLRRLRRMDDQLARITQDGLEGEGHVRMGGDDELAAVARTINALLDRVRSDAAQQRDSFARQEALQLQLMQSQKMEAIGRFTGGIAHDFNNSLAGINGWVRLAMEDLPANHPSHEALAQALKGSGYAGGLMRQLMAFSRQSELSLERLHLGEIIEQTRAFVGSGLLKRTQVHYQPFRGDDVVMADPTQLQQVLVNLLINASDAMEGAGSVRLELDARTLPLEGQQVLPGSVGLSDGMYLHLQVCDEGPGIAPELLDRIFEPFFTTKAVGRGTGLGLSVAHGIVGRHRGSIGVSSQLGKGTCFHLLLPVADPLDQEPAATPAEVPSRKHRVLFVDDDQLVRHSWGGLLERHGWEVVRARDGEEAWLHYAQSGERWDVVLTDLSMPRLDGKGLAQRIATSHRPVPVVLVSGQLNADQIRELKASGLFADVLPKPLDDRHLDTVLRSCLASSHRSLS